LTTQNRKITPKCHVQSNSSSSSFFNNARCIESRESKRSLVWQKAIIDQKSAPSSDFWGEARRGRPKASQKNFSTAALPLPSSSAPPTVVQTPKPVRMMRIFALLALAAPAAAQLTCAEDLDGDGNVNVSLTARTDQLPDLALGAGTDNKRIDVRAGQ
jgi:hypothetical protein